MLRAVFHKLTRQLVLVAAGAALIVPLAAAQEKAPFVITRHKGECVERATEPLLHEPTGRYFQLVSCSDSACCQWYEAFDYAAESLYKGRRGRLAFPDRPDVHAFILSNFEFGDLTAIGLRYFCTDRSLRWLDGRRLEAGFAVWDRRWFRSGDLCGHQPYMPVYYTADKRWQATGLAKGMRHYLVEYPPPPE